MKIKKKNLKNKQMILIKNLKTKIKKMTIIKIYNNKSMI